MKPELQALYRDRRVTFVRLIQVLFFALASGMIYFQIKDSFAAKSRAFFLLTIIPLLFGMVSLLVVFPQQKVLFQREYNSNTYSTLMFTLSFILIEIPREIIHMLIFCAIAYSTIGLDGPWLYYWINLFLCSFSGGTFGMLFGTICNSSSEAAQMVPASLIPLLMFSDGIVPIDSLPVFVSWLANVDPMYYLFRCFMIIEFDGVTYPRTLTEEDQYVCDRYENRNYYYTNSSNGANDTYQLYNCSYYNETEFTTPSPTIPVSPNPNFQIDVTADTNFNGSSSSGITTIIANFTTTQSEEQQRYEAYCAEEVSSDYFFDAKDLKPSDLWKYWVIIFAISICVRTMSILILYMINNNTFSWLCNIKNKFSWCSKENILNRKKSPGIQLSINECKDDETLSTNASESANFVLDVDDENVNHFISTNADDPDDFVFDGNDEFENITHIEFQDTKNKSTHF